MSEATGREFNIEKSFTQTRLYGFLKRRSQNETRAKKILALVDRTLEKAEDVLRIASTSPLDFTLHDNLHSFRVAEKMISVLPPAMAEKLSSEEIGLLLLAAYLHDIGMSPPFDKIRKYRDICMGEQAGSASKSEIEDFFAWFDSSEFADVVHIPIRLSDPAVFNQLEQVLTYFVRAKHNSWSADWIEKNISASPLEKYPAFRDDLIRLCKSHHFGREELSQDDYRPKQIGVSESSIIVHLRYLACVLRVADILDFDPERTPHVIYQHRGITPGSRIYWHQTFEINAALSPDRERFVFEATPPDAAIHQALKILVSDINRELQLCRRLDESHPFRYSVSGEIPYVWDFPSELSVSITPRGNAYEFIEGAFRPNTTKLLQLLSGTNLYRSELDAVRELLQNAFDAVKESLAYEIVRGHLSAKSEGLVSAAMEVELRIEDSDGQLFLVCADTGVGMTKKIIENYVLVSGNSRSKELRWLERELASRGMELGRTGTFGIGILSYFMLADQVAITTRRSQLCGDEDSTGWIFKTDGIGSFGELRRQAHRLRGTEVRLRIKNSIADTGVQMEQMIIEYLRNILVRIPCSLRFVGPQHKRSWQPGWVKSAEDFTTAILQSTKREDDAARGKKLLSSEARERRVRDGEMRRALESQLRSSLRWRVLEGVLTNGIGVYRAHLPYFELRGGISLAFVWIKDDTGVSAVEMIGIGHYFVPHCETVEAWQGMRYTATGFQYSARWFVEVDWTSTDAGEISVDRWKVRRNKDSQTAAKELSKKLRQDLRDFLRKHSDSMFEPLSVRLVRLPSRAKTAHWISPGVGTVQWAPVPYPNYVGSARDIEQFVGERRLYAVPLMREYGSDYDWEGVGWASWKADPDRMLVVPRFGGAEIIPVFDGPPKVSSLPYVSSVFPREWNAVMGVFIDDLYGNEGNTVVWNRDNPIVKRFSADGWVQVRRMLSNLKNSTSSSLVIDTLLNHDQLLNDEGFLANLLGRIFAEGEIDLWTALLETDKDLGYATKSLMEASEVNNCYFRGEYSWFELSPTSIRKVDSSTGLEIKKVLPKPSEQWLVREVRDLKRVRRAARFSDPWA